MSRPTVLAAGGVLWRHDPSDQQVAVVHRPQYDDWSLPEGKAKPGQHLLVTALREMSEETGYRPRIGPYLTTVRYRVTSGGRSANKAVTYWSMRCAGGSFQASREVDAVQWLPLGEARRRLTSSSDRVVLDTFARSHRDTEPLLLVRHGATSAPARRLKRPPAPQRLNRSGRDQAAALVPVLEGLAEATGLTVRCEVRLTRAGFAGNERDVADRVRQDASSSEALVVCGQQRVITGLLGALSNGAGVRPPQDTVVKKGGWWLLHHRGGAVSAYERHDSAA